MIEKSFNKLDLFPEARWLSRVFVSDYCMPRGREIAERTERAGLFEAASSGELMGLFNLPSEWPFPFPFGAESRTDSHTPKMQTQVATLALRQGARIGEACMTNGRGRSLRFVQSSTGSSR